MQWDKTQCPCTLEIEVARSDTDRGANNQLFTNLKKSMIMQGILICGIMAYLLIVAAVESNRERKEYEAQKRNRKQGK